MLGGGPPVHGGSGARWMARVDWWGAAVVHGARPPWCDPPRSRLMLTLVLRGFVQRKLRVLTAVAIALGVALMAGTYILTDTDSYKIPKLAVSIGQTSHLIHGNYSQQSAVF